MLEILCRKRSSKPEPISVVICRKLVVILFVSIAITVLVILSIGVNKDTPTITRKYSPMDKFPVPVVIIEFKYQFKINCYYFSFNTTTGTSCNEYVQQPTYYNNSSGFWKGSFSQDNLSFIDNNSTTSDQLILDFELTDPNYNSHYTSFSISMHDQEYDTYNDPLASGIDDYSIFVKSLQEYVYCNPGSRHILEVSRKQRTMLKGSPLNDLGLPQKYPSQTYIVINDHLVRTTGNTTLIIWPQNYLLETEIEQRNKNALTVISNVLAVWGGLTALYIFLFGADSIKPWGFIQERILKNETRNKLMSAPFFKKEGTPEERIEALETFLKDHVVDISLIDQSNKSPYQKINPSS